MDTDSDSQMYVLLGGKVSVPLLNLNNLTNETIEKVLQCKKWNDWVDSFDSVHVDVKSISLLNVYMFGHSKVGFIQLLVDAKSKGDQPKSLPEYVFIRGKAVAVLVIVNQKYMLLVNQFRVPAGRYMLEAPAGMMDESGNFLGTAAKEIEEETGIHINSSNLISLGSFYPSPGGMDEEISLYYTNVSLTDEQINERLSKTYGEEGEHEQISLILLEFNKDNIVKTMDAKLITAAFCYEKLLNTSI